MDLCDLLVNETTAPNMAFFHLVVKKTRASAMALCYFESEERLSLAMAFYHLVVNEITASCHFL